SRPSCPSHEASAVCSRSSPQSMSPPPSAKDARRCDPEPSEPRGPGPQPKTCSSSCLSWLHPLRSWSLRQTRGGSYRRASAAYAIDEEMQKLGTAAVHLLTIAMSYMAAQTD